MNDVVTKAYALHQALCDHFGDRMPTPIDDHATELLTALDKHTALSKAEEADPYLVHGCLDPDSWPTQEDDGRPMHDILDRG